MHSSAMLFSWATATVMDGSQTGWHQLPLSTAGDNESAWQPAYCMWLVYTTLSVQPGAPNLNTASSSYTPFAHSLATNYDLSNQYFRNKN